MRSPRAPTSLDVARLAGVSRATVSAVVNGGPKFVSEATRDRVIDAIATLDYQPDNNARGLKNSRTQTVGVLLPSITSPFWPPVVRAAEQRLRERGYRLLLANTDEDAVMADAAVESFLRSRVDGMIAAPPFGVTYRPYRTFVDSGRPLVFIERHVLGLNADRVTVDDELGGYLAAKHLLALGRRTIGVVAMPLQLESSARRVEGIRRALFEAHLILPDHFIHATGFSETDGFRDATAFLRDQIPLDALIVCSLRLTTGVMTALRTWRIPVPGRMAVVGYDEMPWAALCEPSLTVVQQPAAALGKAAADLLLERLAAQIPATPRTVVLQPQLLIRRSSGGVGTPAPSSIELDAL